MLDPEWALQLCELTWIFYPLIFTHGSWSALCGSPQDNTPSKVTHEDLFSRDSWAMLTGGGRSQDTCFLDSTEWQGLFCVLTLGGKAEINWSRTSLVVQWLRLFTPNAGVLGLIPGQGTRSHILPLRLHMPQLKKKKKKMLGAAVKVLVCCNKDQGSRVPQVRPRIAK